MNITIQRCRLELTFPDQATATQLGLAMRQFFYDKLLNNIEAHLLALLPPNVLPANHDLVIDKLVLDLGVIPHQQWMETLSERAQSYMQASIQKQLTDKLSSDCHSSASWNPATSISLPNNQLRYKPIPRTNHQHHLSTLGKAQDAQAKIEPTNAYKTVKPESYRPLRLLTHLLRYGTKPWWTNIEDTLDTPTLLVQAIKEHPEQTCQIFWQYLQEPTFRQRLARYVVSPENLLHLAYVKAETSSLHQLNQAFTDTKNALEMLGLTASLKQFGWSLPHLVRYVYFNYLLSVASQNHSAFAWQPQIWVASVVACLKELRIQLKLPHESFVVFQHNFTSQSPKASVLLSAIGDALVLDATSTKEELKADLAMDSAGTASLIHALLYGNKVLLSQAIKEHPEQTCQIFWQYLQEPTFRQRLARYVVSPENLLHLAYVKAETSSLHQLNQAFTDTKNALEMLGLTASLKQFGWSLPHLVRYVYFNYLLSVASQNHSAFVWQPQTWVASVVACLQELPGQEILQDLSSKSDRLTKSSNLSTIATALPDAIKEVFRNKTENPTKATDQADHIYQPHQHSKQPAEHTGLSTPEIQPAKPEWIKRVTLDLFITAARKEKEAGTSKTYQKLLSAMESQQEEPLYIDHAGLIWIAAFLPQLFKHCEFFTKEKDWQPGAQLNALYLLHYLITGQTGTQEHQLSLNKLLVGYPLAQPVMQEISLTEPQCKAADDLLAAVINHWRQLKNTSPQGLRQAFLQRPGRLVEAADSWQLHLEKATHDVLLGSLPWSYQITRYPWMNKPILVADA